MKFSGTTGWVASAGNLPGKAVGYKCRRGLTLRSRVLYHEERSNDPALLPPVPIAAEDDGVHCRYETDADQFLPDAGDCGSTSVGGG